MVTGAATIDSFDDTTSDGVRSGDARGLARTERSGTSVPPSDFGFSTGDLPPNGRFETWRDLFVRRLIGVEVSTESSNAFNGQARLWSAGSLSIAEISSSNLRPTQFVRNAMHVRNGDDDFSLSLFGHEAAIQTPQGDDLKVSDRGALFLRHDRPFRIVTPGQEITSYMMRIDRTSLLDLLPRNIEPHASEFPPDSAMVDMIWRYLPLIINVASDTSAQSRETLGRHIVDLVALMLRPSRDGAELIRGRGLKAVRTKVLLDMIDRHFAMGDLTPGRIGHQLGISARQVHRLLEETPKTFEEHVLERRLQHAYRLLTEPGKGPSRIVDVALASGFSGVTQFNRAFRARFGDTPSGVRGTVVREETLRVLRGNVKSAR